MLGEREEAEKTLLIRAGPCEGCKQQVAGRLPFPLGQLQKLSPTAIVSTLRLSYPAGLALAFVQS